MAVVLSVNGLNFSGWKSVSIQQSMETLAGGFDLSISERWPGQETERPIKPGDKCTLKIQGTTVITGYVDQVNPSYDDKNHEVQVSGRGASVGVVS